MVDPIPEKVKSCLGELTPAQQVILRGYIGTLRASVKDKENEMLAAKDDDPNAHYHGEHKCTEDQYVSIVSKKNYVSCRYAFILAVHQCYICWFG